MEKEETEEGEALLGENRTGKPEQYQAEYTDEKGKRNAERKAASDAEEVKEAIKELEELEKDTEKAPVIPRFKKSGKAANVSEKKIAEMRETTVTKEEEGHFISRAVANREKAEMAAAIEMIDSIDTTEHSEDGMEEKAALSKKDKDIKTDAQGNEYVQATMQFDEDFEIMEF